MSASHKAKKSKKNRKWDRNRISCSSYRNTNRREKNKLIRLKKHLFRFGNDLVALAAVENCKKAIKGF